jgi:hypothetical protein
MAKTKEEKLSEVHESALKEFDQIHGAVQDERAQCIEDRRFYSIAGAQWEGKLGDQYENRPKLEINKCHLAVMRIISEYRNNRITVDFTPRRPEDDDLADFCDGLFRADEQDSEAREAYDNAFEEGVGGGIGAWRLRTEYEDEYDPDNDYQRIRFEPIYDADKSVFFDLNAKRQDKADAMSCFVLNPMTRESYIEEYGDDPVSWPNIDDEPDFDWVLDDSVYVAEYYKIKEKKEEYIYFENILGDEEKRAAKDVTDEDLKNLEDIGTKEKYRRKIKTRKVHKYIMSGGGVLEDCGVIAGKCIPIVPFYGKRWMVDNIERCMGQVRLAKDPQRLLNMQFSELAIHASTSSEEIPIFDPKQIKGVEGIWADQNVKRYTWLPAKALTDAEGNIIQSGPSGYTKPTQLPPALAACIQLSESSVQDIMGRQQAGEEISNQTSGRAVELIQDRIDMQTYIYLSNLEKSHKRSGEIYLEMAKDIYVDDKRPMKIITKEGEVSSKPIMISSFDGEDAVVESNLSNANFDVNVEVGPSSSSKREAISRKIDSLLAVTNDPENRMILESMGQMHMEAEGMKGIREYHRKKLVKMGVEEPTEDDIEEMELEGKPNANEEFLLAEAERAKAEAEEKRASTVSKIADAEYKKAQSNSLRVDTAIKVQESKAPAAVPVEQAPMGPVVDEVAEARVLMDAKAKAKELELKEREIEMAEKRLELEIAKAGVVTDERTGDVENGYEVLARQSTAAIQASMEELSEALEGQRKALEGQTKTMEDANRERMEASKEALDALKAPKKIVRKDGEAVGIKVVD